MFPEKLQGGRYQHLLKVCCKSAGQFQLKRITVIIVLFITVINTAFGQQTLKSGYRIKPLFVIKAKDGTLSGL